jgi:prenyl protein peptidase
MVPFLQISFESHNDKANWYVIVVCPLMFMLAHVHHLYEKLRNGIPLISAVLSTLVQSVYTSIFGCVATILLMRTGNILSPILSHMVCNTIGLPNIGFMFAPGSQLANEYSFMHGAKYLHLLLHITGLFIFGVLLFPLTAKTALDSPLWA